MDQNDATPELLAPEGTALAPIHASADAPIRLCVLVRLQPKSDAFVLLREVPTARVFLGAVCDAAGRILNWVEIWVQSSELRDLAFSGYQEHLTNELFDQRWRADAAFARENLPEAVVVSGMEEINPGPVLVKTGPAKPGEHFAAVEFVPWRLCKDDALLEKAGLPRYSNSAFRYLYDPASPASGFIATVSDAPTNPQVKALDQLAAGVRAVFNPGAGLIRVVKFDPLGFANYLQILEGEAWSADDAEGLKAFNRGVPGDLQKWSANQKGLRFRLYDSAKPAERLGEVLLLKLSALLDVFKQTRGYVAASQLPLLNLAPASFRVRLPNTSGPFPALWCANTTLVKPGQAHALKLKATDQRYFLRLGPAESSPYLPDAVGALSQGIGSLRLRNVLTESDGVVLEGTLVGEDYLKLEANDLLWFKLPIDGERLEFYAHVHGNEAVGPREARFRTVPTKVSEAALARLKSAAGTAFAKSPYEVWPLLSSPCDLHSLGIIATRTLLANSSTNLPTLVDDILGLARLFGQEGAGENSAAGRLKALLEKDRRLLDLVSPHALAGKDLAPARARELIPPTLWLEAVLIVLRCFPGAGSHSYCKSFGDVSALALENVFDRPIQELESLVLRFRGVLLPSLSANEEIAAVLRQALTAA